MKFKQPKCKGNAAYINVAFTLSIPNFVFQFYGHEKVGNDPVGFYTGISCSTNRCFSTMFHLYQNSITVG